MYNERMEYGRYLLGPRFKGSPRGCSKEEDSVVQLVNVCKYGSRDCAMLSINSMPTVCPSHPKCAVTLAK